MSWSELERLVEEAEADPALGRGLRHCRSRRELLLACWRLGYGITGRDLRQAWALHQAGEHDQQNPQAWGSSRSVP